MGCRYMIADSQNEPLCRAVLESPPDAAVWRLRVLDGGLSRVLEHEVVNLISTGENAPDMTGRILLLRQDLLCGGIAFFCDFPLQLGEVAEVVVPITAQPLILRAKILRRRPSNSAVPLYSAKFVDMIHDQEVLVREAVFSQQIANRDAQK